MDNFEDHTPQASATSGPGLGRGGSKGSSGAGGGQADGYLSGHILIAMPGMRDERFVQSIICLCAHSIDGAMGIVLNKPLDNISFEDLIRQLGVEPVPPRREIMLCSGGPVESGRGFVLHTADWTCEGSLRVVGDLALTASVDILKAFAEGGGPREGVLALGYAGWGPGQLEDEIQRNAWLSVGADEALIFGRDLSAKWREALGRLKVDPLLLSSSAGHA